MWALSCGHSGQGLGSCEDLTQLNTQECCSFAWPAVEAGCQLSRVTNGTYCGSSSRLGFSEHGCGFRERTPGVSQEARWKWQGSWAPRNSHSITSPPLARESPGQPILKGVEKQRRGQKILWRPPLDGTTGTPSVRTSVCKPGRHFSNCWSFPGESVVSAAL